MQVSTVGVVCVSWLKQSMRQGRFSPCRQPLGPSRAEIARTVQFMLRACLTCIVCHSAIHVSHAAAVVCRTYQVSCLGDVTKLLRKHSKPQERLEKVVHSVLQELKPSASSVGRLLARLEAAAMRHKGVPSM